MLKLVIQKQLTYMLMKLIGSGQFPLMAVCDDGILVHEKWFSYENLSSHGCEYEY
jgi:hypothetical protein